MKLNDVLCTIYDTLPKLRTISETLWLMRTAGEDEKSDLKLSSLENFLRSLDMDMNECVKTFSLLTEDIHNFLDTEEKVKQEVQTNE